MSVRIKSILIIGLMLLLAIIILTTIYGRIV
jgi:hypothetical protein